MTVYRTATCTVSIENGRVHVAGEPTFGDLRQLVRFGRIAALPLTATIPESEPQAQRLAILCGWRPGRRCMTEAGAARIYFAPRWARDPAQARRRHGH